MTLREIIAHYDINGHEKDGGTDKDTFHSYIELYERLLAPFVDKAITLVEIGIQYGGSMLLWQDYLPKAQFVFVDNVNSIHPKILDHVDSDRTSILFQDAYNDIGVEDVDHLAKSGASGGIDFIIDDGPHTLQSQIDFLRLYLPLLNEGGIALIEDVQDVQWFASLEAEVEKLGSEFAFERVDLRGVKGRYDDLVFVVQKL
jgi:cephalosporin hydroxylase